MVTSPFDTHRLVNTLKGRGFSADQASGITEAMQEIDLTNLVTKQDLKVELASFKAELFVALVPILLAQAALIVALMEYFGSK